MAEALGLLVAHTLCWTGQVGISLQSTLTLTVASMGDICVFAKIVALVQQSPALRLLRCRPGLQCNQRQAVEPVDLNSDNRYTRDPSAIKSRENGAY